jgi:hypothetical protein
MQAADVPPEQIEARLPRRLDRRKILTRSKPPKLDMIVAETALRHVVGSPRIMAEQLSTMLDVAELPNVRLWVVPFAQTAPAGFGDSFYLMDFPGARSVVVVESYTSVIYLVESRQVGRLRC